MQDHSLTQSVPARTVQQVSAFQFGLVGAAGGVGAVIGAAVTTRVGRRVGTGRTIILCHVVTTLGLLARTLAGQLDSRALAMTALLPKVIGCLAHAASRSRSVTREWVSTRRARRTAASIRAVWAAR